MHRLHLNQDPGVAPLSRPRRGCSAARRRADAYSASRGVRPKPDFCGNVTSETSIVIIIVFIVYIIIVIIMNMIVIQYYCCYHHYLYTPPRTDIYGPR